MSHVRACGMIEPRKPAREMDNGRRVEHILPLVEAKAEQIEADMAGKTFEAAE